MSDLSGNVELVRENMAINSGALAKKGGSCRVIDADWGDPDCFKGLGALDLVSATN